MAEPEDIRSICEAFGVSDDFPKWDEEIVIVSPKNVRVQFIDGLKLVDMEVIGRREGTKKTVRIIVKKGVK